jgi:hypothetical protein
MSEIINIKNLINFIGIVDKHQNQYDVRSITIHSLFQVTQSFLFSKILAKEISDIEYCKENFSTDIQTDDLEVLQYNYDGFISNAFFINYFVHIENHIRQVAMNYENNPKEINVSSITQTFKNLMNINKTNVFQQISHIDYELFEFYCFMRNTMHNVGFQTREAKTLILDDRDSVVYSLPLEIKLEENVPASVSSEKSLLISEQILKLILKINSLIPESDFIKHRFSDIGFNE